MSSAIHSVVECAPEVKNVDVRERSEEAASSGAGSWCGSELDGQILELVQQLFFHPQSAVRYVGITAIDAGIGVWPLCFNVATTLAESCKREIGLVDARVQPNSGDGEFERELQTREPQRLRPNLQLVTPHERLNECGGSNPTHACLGPLQAEVVKFDQTVVCLDALSWKTARIATICDGLVLVVTANKTRRVVAAQAATQLKRAGVRLLGVVLAERKFPVPDGLYRKL